MSLPSGFLWKCGNFSQTELSRAGWWSGSSFLGVDLITVLQWCRNKPVGVLPAHVYVLSYQFWFLKEIQSSDLIVNHFEKLKLSNRLWKAARFCQTVFVFGSGWIILAPHRNVWIVIFQMSLSCTLHSVSRLDQFYRFLRPSWSWPHLGNSSSAATENTPIICCVWRPLLIFLGWIFGC